MAGYFSELNYLFNDLTPKRYLSVVRGNFFVLLGYIIVSLQTLAAKAIGLTSISWQSIIAITLAAISFTIAAILVTRFKRRFLVWHELLIFGVQLAGYIVLFSLWIYFLGEMRILGLVCSLIAVTIVITFTGPVHSLLMSIFTIISYLSVTYYAISLNGQPGNITKEFFLVLCLLPVFLIMAFTASYINRNRNRLRKTQKELEKLNDSLREINYSLMHEQHIREIEMDLAREIQSSLFPSVPTETSDWDIAHLIRPRHGVAGDFFDFFCEGNSLNGISLFDVSGHGVSSALITIMAKPIIYKNFKNFQNNSLGKVLKSANEDLKEQLENVDSFITGVILRTRGDSVEYVNAGHPDILLYRASTGSARTVSDPEGKHRGRPLGVSGSRAKYSTLKFRILKNDYLVIYSDGLIESRGAAGETYGNERVAEIISRNSGKSAGDILNAIMSDFNGFINNEPPADDLTIIVARKL